MSLTRLEQETILLFNEQESTASIYTHNERLKAQTAEHTRQNPDKISKNMLDLTGALHCELPKGDLRILLKKPRSEKQLHASRENARKMRGKINLPTSAEGQPQSRLPHGILIPSPELLPRKLSAVRGFPRPVRPQSRPEPESLPPARRVAHPVAPVWAFPGEVASAYFTPSPAVWGISARVWKRLSQCGFPQPGDFRLGRFPCGIKSLCRRRRHKAKIHRPATPAGASGMA